MNVILASYSFIAHLGLCNLMLAFKSYLSHFVLPALMTKPVPNCIKLKITYLLLFGGTLISTQ